MTLGDICTIIGLAMSIPASYIGGHYHKKSLRQEEVISDHERNPRVVFIEKRIIVPCDTMKYYKEGLEVGRKQNWHYTDNNITLIKEGNHIRYDFPKDTFLLRKNKRIVKGRGEINFHEIGVK